MASHVDDDGVSNFVINAVVLFHQVDMHFVVLKTSPGMLIKYKILHKHLKLLLAKMMPYVSALPFLCLIATYYSYPENKQSKEILHSHWLRDVSFHLKSVSIWGFYR